MRIAYIFMKYPLPAQPFAISDMEALTAAGHQVDTYALSGRHPDHDVVTAAYDLRFGPGSHPGPATALACLDPQNARIAAHLVKLIFRHGAGRALEAATALALAPRMVEIAALLRRRPPDVIHAFWGHYPAYLLALAARFFPATHRSMFLGAYDLTTHRIGFSTHAAGLADSIWTHADDNLPLLQAMGAPMSRVRVVMRGVPLALADDSAPPREPELICTAANFQKEKNLDLLLRAFALLHARRPATRLTIAGDGDERARLAALARDLGVAQAVCFPGMLPRSALFAEMRRAAVFAFLSVKASERLPNVVKEAMLAGCRCVVLPTPGIEALIEPGVTGDLVVSATPAHVADALDAALASPDIAVVGARAAARIRERFSTAALMRPYIDAWSAPIAPAGGPRQRV